MAADLSFTIGFDDSQLTAGLTKADAKLKEFGANATKTFKDLSDTIKNMQASFDSLNNNIKQSGEELDKLNGKKSGVSDLENAFGSLKTTLLAVFSAGFAKSAIDFAASIELTARAVGFTVPEFEKLSTAVIRAGGTSRAAAVGIEMFYQKLDQARQGGLQQQVAFERLGITLSDLKNLTDKELFERTVTELAGMTDNAARSRIEVELLSRAFRGIPLKDIADGLNGYGAGLKSVIEDQDALIGATYAGNEAFKKLTLLQREVKLAFLEAVEPALAAFGKFQITVDELASGFRLLISVLAAVIAVGFTGWVIGVVASFGKLITLIYDTVAALRALSVAEALAMNATGIGALLNVIAKAVVGLAAFFGIQYAINDVLKDNTQENRDAARAQEETTKKTMEATRSNQEVYTSYARLNAAIRENTLNFIENQKRIIDKIGAQDASIGKTEAERKAIEASTKIQDDYAKKIEEVTAKLKAARAARPESEESRTAGTLAAQIPILEKARDLQVARAAASARQLALDQEDAADSLRLQGQQSKLQENLIALREKYAAAKMGPLESENAKIAASWDKIAEAEIRAAREKEKVEKLGFNQAGVDREQQIRDNAQAKGREQIAENTKLYKQQQDDFVGGWTGAFDRYIENASNANKRGAALFDSFVSTMDSAIDSFVKNGKMSFADLITSLIQDLEKYLLKLALVEMFKTSGLGTIFGGASAAASGGFLSGIFSGFADLFHANGGSIPAGGFGIVGEAGPEIVSGPANVTSAKDTAAMLGGGGDTHNHFYNIQAVDAKSVAQLFAENRQTMFGLVEQARRELPMRAR